MPHVQASPESQPPCFGLIKGKPDTPWRALKQLWERCDKHFATRGALGSLPQTLQASKEPNPKTPKDSTPKISKSPNRTPPPNLQRQKLRHLGHSWRIPTYSDALHHTHAAMDADPPCAVEGCTGHGTKLCLGSTPCWCRCCRCQCCPGAADVVKKPTARRNVSAKTGRLDPSA